MFLDQVIHFGKYLGDQVKGRSPKELKSLIEVPCVAYLKVQVVSFNMILISSSSRVPRPSCPFRGQFGRTGKCRATRKLKLLIEVPYVTRLKVHVLRFNMNLSSSR